METIQWKQIKDYPNYEISPCGNVMLRETKVLMKLQINQLYYKIGLSKNSKKKQFFVHVLVANHFIPKINGKDFVNHKDGNKLNNNVENLEWVTKGENLMHAYKTGLKLPSTYKLKINQYDKDNNLIKEWDSLQEIRQTLKISRRRIKIACDGGRNTTGYIWKNTSKMNEMEDIIWKHINIDGLREYMISNHGQIKNKHGIILKNSILGGYCKINIGTPKRIDYFMHRLVAMTFILNPNNLPIINHKNGNKLDNHVDNLEWCTQSHNIKHAIETGLFKPTPRIGVKITQKDLLGNTIKTFDSIKDASNELKIRYDGIQKALCKIKPHYYRFIWEYTN